MESKLIRALRVTWRGAERQRGEQESPLPRAMTKEEQKKDAAAKATDGTDAKTAEAASGAEAIEEDDAFEEFEPSAWGAHDEDAEDVQQWQVRLNHIMPVCYVF